MKLSIIVLFNYDIWGELYIISHKSPKQSLWDGSDFNFCQIYWNFSPIKYEIEEKKQQPKISWMTPLRNISQFDARNQDKLTCFHFFVNTMDLFKRTVSLDGYFLEGL